MQWSLFPVLIQLLYCGLLFLLGHRFPLIQCSSLGASHENLPLPFFPPSFPSFFPTFSTSFWFPAPKVFVTLGTPNSRCCLLSPVGPLSSGYHHPSFPWNVTVIFSDAQTEVNGGLAWSGSLLPACLLSYGFKQLFMYFIHSL